MVLSHGHAGGEGVSWGRRHRRSKRWAHSDACEMRTHSAGSRRRPGRAPEGTGLSSLVLRGRRTRVSPFVSPRTALTASPLRPQLRGAGRAWACCLCGWAPGRFPMQPRAGLPGPFSSAQGREGRPGLAGVSLRTEGEERSPRTPGRPGSRTRAGRREGVRGRGESWPWPPSRPTSTLAVFRLGALPWPSSFTPRRRTGGHSCPRGRLRSTSRGTRRGPPSCLTVRSFSLSAVTRFYSAFSLFRAKVEGERAEAAEGVWVLLGAGLGTPPSLPVTSSGHSDYTSVPWGGFSKAVRSILGAVSGADVFGEQIGWRR